eukprot:6701140-Heterocapsa_arctica.AAC.1
MSENPVSAPGRPRPCNTGNSKPGGPIWSEVARMGDTIALLAKAMLKSPKTSGPWPKHLAVAPEVPNRGK